MKRLLLLSVFAFFVPAAWADDEIGFVRGLRARGYSDLALAYLDRLQKTPNLPQDVVESIPLELASTTLDLAVLEQSEQKRRGLAGRARRQFQQCTTSKDAAVVAEAQLGLARIEAWQADAKLRDAMRVPGGQRESELADAKKELRRTADGLRKASAALASVLPTLPDVRKNTLAQTRVLAEYELGINLYGQMLASSGDFKEQADANAKAMAQFKAVDQLDPKSVLAWQARAWVYRCLLDSETMTEAATEFTRLSATGDPNAAEGKRLARYFRLFAIDRDNRIRDPIGEYIAQAEKWLEDYSAYQNTAESRDVRSRLARVHLKNAKKHPSRADASHRRAEDLYASLEDGDDPLAEDARLRHLQLIAQRLKMTAKTDVASLNDFTDCFVRAQVEIWEMAKDPKKAAENQKQHYETIVAALERALALAKEQTSRRERSEAIALLAYAMLMTGENAKVIELSEQLMRDDPESKHASASAAYALHAYMRIVADLEKKQSPTVEVHAKQMDLAKRIEKLWPDSPAADYACHQLGLFAIRDKKYGEAIDYLSRISNQYGSRNLAQYQLAHAALIAHREKVEPGAGKPAWLKVAEDTLTRIPDPSIRADSETITYYFLAKLELAKLRFQLRQFNDMDALVKHLNGIFEKLENENHKKAVQPSLDMLALYAAYGQADTANTSGRPDRSATIVTLLDPVVARLESKPIKDIDPQLLRALLGMALRANIQEGNTKQAVRTLELAEKSGNDFEGTSAVMIDLVAQMRGDLERLRDKGASHKKELARAMERFGEFLDEIAKNLGETPSKERLRFLALAYSILERHDKSTSLLAMIPKPKEPLKPEDERFYRSMKLLYVRELRLAKKYAEAKKELDAILKEQWGRENLEAKKEQIHLLEDEEKFGTAKVKWFELARDLKAPSRSNPQLKEQYYECYYRLTWCATQQGARSKDEKKKHKYLREAANFIVSLEKSDETMGGLKERYEKLLKESAELKREYDDLKKASP